MRFIYRCPCGKWGAVAIRRGSSKYFECDECGAEWDSEEELIKHQPKYKWHTADSDLYWELR